MTLCLFEDDGVHDLFPLTRTRAAFDLRLGLRTILQTTREAFGRPRTLLHTRKALAAVTAQETDLLTNRLPGGLDVFFVNGRYVAEDGPLLERLRRAATDGEARAFVQGETVVAAFVPEAPARLLDAEALTPDSFANAPEEKIEGATLISRVWHLLDALRPALKRDFEARVNYNVYERPGANVQEGAQLVRGEKIFIAPGATIRAGAVISAEDGPIYIDEGAVVMENAVVRGTVYVGPRSQVRVGANVEGSAFGPRVKVGGEVHDSTIHACSNKVHAGFLGHSYVGRWCNLGAGTTTSNMKNDYGPVTVYSPAAERFEDTGRQFAGLFMGDHSKCGIGTIFNTGTIVDVFCNLYGAGFPPRYVPPFSWGSPAGGFAPYRLEKALRVAETVMARRDVPLTEADRALLTMIAETRQENA